MIEDRLSPLLYSSLSRRFAAFLIDSAILGALLLIFGHLVPIIGGIAVWILYAPVLESSALKATIGKNLLGIEVVDEAGRRISFRSALVRNLLKIVSTAILLIGFVFALFTARKQTLHDLLAETYVVYGRDDQPMAEAWVENVKEVYGSVKTGLGVKGSPGAAKDAISQLERLQALRDRGALTDAEFEAAKSRLLGEI